MNQYKFDDKFAKQVLDFLAKQVETASENSCLCEDDKKLFNVVKSEDETSKLDTKNPTSNEPDLNKIFDYKHLFDL